MGIAASLALLIGLSLAMALIAWQGFGEVVHALASAGWGLLVIAAFHLAPMLINTRAWSTLFRLQDRLSFPRLLVARWIGESINSLLPVAQIGGELAKARWIAHLGIDANVAGASAVLDLTIAVLTQIIFTLLGLLLLVLQLGNDDLLFPAILGTVSISVLLAGFYIAQRRGMFEKSVVLITHLAPGREGWGIHGSAVALDAAIHAMYRNRKRLAVASAWRLCGWIIGAGEVWLAMIFLKLPVTPAQAGKLKKWIDENGQVQYGDSIPPRYAKKSIQTLNSEGVVIKTRAAAKTPKQIAEEKRLAALKASKERVRKVQARKDRILLDTFTNEDEMIMTRDGKVEAIEAIIRVTKGRIEKIRQPAQTTG